MPFGLSEMIKGHYVQILKISQERELSITSVSTLSLLGLKLQKFLVYLPFLKDQWNDEQRSFLIEPIVGGKLKQVVHSFKKDKSPTHNGWPIEFFIGFYDLIELDL